MAITLPEAFDVDEDESYENDEVATFTCKNCKLTHYFDPEDEENENENHPDCTRCKKPLTLL